MVVEAGLCCVVRDFSFFLARDLDVHVRATLNPFFWGYNPV